MDEKLESKIDIIYQFIEEALEEPEFENFFRGHDLGYAYVIGVINGHINLNQEAYSFIEDTYEDLCKLFNADPNEEYLDISELTSGEY